MVSGRSFAHDATMLQERVDKVGIVASTMCAVHCTIGALLIGATGAGRVFADEKLEVAFVAFAILVAVGALTLGYRRHRSILPMMVGAAGILPLGGARLIEFGGESAEVVFSVLGAGFLVGAHWLNLRRLRSHSACCAPSESTTSDALSRRRI